MVYPEISSWSIISAKTGLPVDAQTTKAILQTIKQRGIIDASEMQIGLSGFVEEEKIDASRNQIARIRETDKGLMILTTNYREYIAQRGDMLSNFEANLQAKKEKKQKEKTSIQNRKNPSMSDMANAMIWGFTS